MMAHITYLSEQGMELKFGRERRAEGPMTMDSDFEVEHYLDHQAEIFLARFDPLTYLYLSRVMDYFEPFAERPARPDTRFLALSFDSDWRFGTEHSRHLTARARGARRRRAPGTRSRRRGGTIPSSWTFPGTRRRWRPSS